MEAAQKFSTFEDLKKNEETATRPRFTYEVKQFLELMRQGEISEGNFGTKED
ncbi:hypothetical protein ACLI1A_04050 [Flavobacterium sp. RHBU_3]|uniref:hypothetical protein n=1 Tax=Flavobacterium sp. RHBU_3 TaxID=3391184 RepID=UPI00398555E1